MPVLINGREYFTGSEGTLSGVISAPSGVHTPPTTRLYWSLKIEAYPEYEYEGKILPARVDAVLFWCEVFSFSKPTRHLKELVGCSFEWKSLNEFDENTPQPRYYWLDHGKMPRGIIRLVEYQNHQFRIQWEWAFEESGDFSIDMWVPFEGLSVVHSEAEDACAVLGHHFAPEGFLQHSSELNDRQNLVVTMFFPTTE